MQTADSVCGLLCGRDGTVIFVGYCTRSESGPMVPLAMFFLFPRLIGYVSK